MNVIRGTLSLQLGDQEVQQYVKGNLLHIPLGAKMNVRNEDEEVLEIIVIKAPAPDKYVAD